MSTLYTAEQFRVNWDWLYGFLTLFCCLPGKCFKQKWDFCGHCCKISRFFYYIWSKTLVLRNFNYGINWPIAAFQIFEMCDRQNMEIGLCLRSTKMHPSSTSETGASLAPYLWQTCLIPTVEISTYFILTNKCNTVPKTVPFQVVHEPSIATL